MDSMKTVVGLETHMQLQTHSKLFCGCATQGYREAEANSRICPSCLSQPGAKPWRINGEAMSKAIKIAVALNCKINVGAQVYMQRKHYIYPDLASGYQRTSKPLGEGGELAGVRIREVHIEEDPGQYDLKTGRVNFNRSGIPLIEIVTEPDMDSPQAARDFLEELSAIMDYLGTARDEPGSMRVDANLSVSVAGAEGVRSEVKNINSFKGVATALAFEAMRHKNLIKNGIAVERETRHFDEGSGITKTLRRKETAEDYRHIPDPDVPPIVITKEDVERARKEIPELPRAKMKRFEKQFGITADEAFAITLEREMADRFEKDAGVNEPKIVANFYRGMLKKQLNYRNLRYKDANVEKAATEMLEMLSRKQITDRVAEQLLIDFLDKKLDPKKNANAQGLLGVQVGKEIEESAKQSIAENPKAAQDYRKGKPEAIHFLAGQVIKKTRGKADPQEAKKILEKLLK